MNLENKRKFPLWLLLTGGVCAAYAGYLLSACYKPGMDINYFMERLDIVTGRLFIP